MGRCATARLASAVTPRVGEREVESVEEVRRSETKELKTPTLCGTRMGDKDAKCFLLEDFGDEKRQ